MISRNKKEIIEIVHGAVPLVEVRRGKILVWEQAAHEEGDVRSCFGSGHWINNLPWLNDDAWVN